MYLPPNFMSSFSVTTKSSQCCSYVPGRAAVQGNMGSQRHILKTTMFPSLGTVDGQRLLSNEWAWRVITIFRYLFLIVYNPDQIIHIF